MPNEEGRKVLGSTLNFDERISLAQLTTQPGWKVLVHVMAEACRRATEEVIKLDPSVERYDQKVIALQTTARAINKFSADVLDSVRVHQQTAVKEAQQRENPTLVPEVPARFRMPIVPQDAK
jgi:hypothetical protein